MRGLESTGPPVPAAIGAGVGTGSSGSTSRLDSIVWLRRGFESDVGRGSRLELIVCWRRVAAAGRGKGSELEALTPAQLEVGREFSVNSDSVDSGCASKPSPVGEVLGSPSSSIKWEVRSSLPPKRDSKSTSSPPPKRESLSESTSDIFAFIPGQGPGSSKSPIRGLPKSKRPAEVRSVESNSRLCISLRITRKVTVSSVLEENKLAYESPGQRYPTEDGQAVLQSPILFKETTRVSGGRRGSKNPHADAPLTSHEGPEMKARQLLKPKCC
jgi:hypothetical protein